MAWLFQRSQRGRPDVIVDFVFERGLLSVAIVNIGDEAAYNVTVAFDRELRAPEDAKPINEMALFRRLLFLPPRKRIATVLGSYSSYFGQNEKQAVEARISFSDRGGKRYSNVVRHDLSIYRDIRYV